MLFESRRPRGRRGLKLVRPYHRQRVPGSPPARAAWIETPDSPRTELLAVRRRPRGRRGLKLGYGGARGAAKSSPPARAAWIENAWIGQSRRDGWVGAAA